MSETRISNLWGKITLVVVICFCSLSAHAKYGGGRGEPNDPYLIYDANQMNAIGADSNDWDKHFKLMADVNLAALTGTQYNIIGSYSNRFTGTFDGNGHTILKFNSTSTGRHYIGLFGYVDDPNAEIEDLGLIDPNIYAEHALRIGPLVGRLSAGTITNCWVDGGRISRVDGVGGLVGENAGTITDCSSSASVSGTICIGGLVGLNDGKITNCYSSGDVCGFTIVGGLVAINGGTISNCYSDASVSEVQVMGGLVGENGGTITNCYSNGSVEGVDIVGGLVGGNNGTITYCYTATSVSGTDDVGGLVGSGPPNYVFNSFWDKETSGQTTSEGGTGLPTAEMQTMSTFTDAGWDFSTPIWKMNCEGMSYPKLSWWQPVLGDFGCPDGVDMRDFAVLAAQWRLPPAEPSADIAPNGGDNIVDRFDLAAMADNWLRGF
jgi:hypothetical protein